MSSKIISATETNTTAGQDDAFVQGSGASAVINTTNQNFEIDSDSVEESFLLAQLAVNKNDEGFTELLGAAGVMFDKGLSYVKGAYESAAEKSEKSQDAAFATVNETYRVANQKADPADVQKIILYVILGAVAVAYFIAKGRG